MSECFLVKPGYMVSLSDPTKEIACPPGTSTQDISSSSNGTASNGTACFPCADGTFAPNTGTTVCIACFRGHYGASTKDKTSKTYCEACPFGKYADEYASGVCKACPAGTFGNITGLHACVDCTHGRASNVIGFKGDAESSNCPACVAGRFASTTRATTCTACARGHFGHARGLEVCVPCDNGTFVNVTGFAGTSCKACTPGRFAAKERSTTCDLCTAGQFQPDAHAVNCNPASPGHFVVAANPVAEHDCPPGKYSNRPGRLTCTACEKGRFGPLPGSIACIVCAPGSASDTTGYAGGKGPIRGQINDTSGVSTLNTRYDPIDDIPGQLGSVATTHDVCRDRCAAVVECAYWSRWSDGRCHLSSKKAIKISESGVTSGTRTGGPSGENVVWGCPLCVRGRYAAERASAGCKLCKAGTFNNKGGMPSCTSCAPGHASSVVGYTGNALGHCPSCVAGKFTNTNGSTVCASCEKGKHGAVKGAHACNVCDPGSSNPTVGLAKKSCPLCGQGKFAATFGEIECGHCNFWEYTTKQDVDGVSTYAGSRGCKTCLAFGETFLGFDHFDQCVSMWVVLVCALLSCCCTPVLICKSRRSGLCGGGGGNGGNGKGGGKNKEIIHVGNPVVVQAPGIHTGNPVVVATTDYPRFFQQQSQPQQPQHENAIPDAMECGSAIRRLRRVASAEIGLGEEGGDNSSNQPGVGCAGGSLIFAHPERLGVDSGEGSGGGVERTVVRSPRHRLGRRIRRPGATWTQSRWVSGSLTRT